MTRLFRGLALAALGAVVPTLLYADAYQGGLDAALEEAGSNRAELETFLARYAQGDAQKRDAARFLVGNMAGKGYSLLRFFDAEKQEVPFEALCYPNYQEALSAFRELEKQHGQLHYNVKSRTFDTKTVSAAFLTQHLEDAFRAWKTRPWAQDVTFETFRDWILPYRGNKEPAENWRTELMARYDGYAQKGERDPLRAGAYIQEDIGRWATFDEIFYLHPTDQGWSEIKRTRKGRCGDLSNLINYALRANAVPCAIDYTPSWADVNNNHAWNVLLNPQGRGSDPVGQRAAKVYRQTFAPQADSLADRKGDGEELPRWLASRYYLDVSEQYFTPHRVAVAFDVPAPKTSKHAYLCVFNTGNWAPIQWGTMRNGGASFEAMNAGLLYLPAYYASDKVVPAADPFLLESNGRKRWLRPSDTFQTMTLYASDRVGDSYRNEERKVSLRAGATYRLQLWEKGDWRTVGQARATDRPLRFVKVPSGALYRLIESEGHREERPFTYEEDVQVWR